MTKEDLQAELTEKFTQILEEDPINAQEKFLDELEERGLFGEEPEEIRGKFKELLDKEMLSPEEIEQSIQIAEHNAKIDQKRAKDLARREERRMKNGKR